MPDSSLEYLLGPRCYAIYDLQEVVVDGTSRIDSLPLYPEMNTPKPCILPKADYI